MRGKLLLTVMVLDGGQTEIHAQCPDTTDPREVPELLRRAALAVVAEWQEAQETKVHGG